MFVCFGGQPAAVNSGDHDGYWKHAGQSSQIHHTNPIQPNYQSPLDLKYSYDKFQDQQKTTSSQGTNSHLPPPPPPPLPIPQQVNQTPLQSAPSLDTKRVSKLQIPTNPRIASNLTFGPPKAEKDSSTTNAALKPAYIAVSLPKPTEKVSSNDAANSILKVRVEQQYSLLFFLLCKMHPRVFHPANLFVLFSFFYS